MNWGDNDGAVTVARPARRIVWIDLEEGKPMHYAQCGNCGNRKASWLIRMGLRQAYCFACGAEGPPKEPGEWLGLDNEAANLRYKRYDRPVPWAQRGQRDDDPVR